MSLLMWLAMGMLAGVMAQLVLKDKWKGGWAGNVILGALGAVVAGWGLRLFESSGLHLAGIGSLAVIFGGGTVLLWVGHCFTGDTVLN